MLSKAKRIFLKLGCKFEDNRFTYHKDNKNNQRRWSNMDPFVKSFNYSFEELDKFTTTLEDTARKFILSVIRYNDVDQMLRLVIIFILLLNQYLHDFRWEGSFPSIFRSFYHRSVGVWRCAIIVGRAKLWSSGLRPSDFITNLLRFSTFNVRASVSKWLLLFRFRQSI